MNTEFKIIVCPNDEKIKILENLNKNSELYNVKFMSKEEFIKNYFFDYTVDTIYYLMDKYKFNLDVCKVYLKNMLVIDVSKEYESIKLNFLKDLKKELISKNLLKVNLFFREYIKNKKIEVRNYFDLDKYEEEALNYKVEIPTSTINADVYECSGIEDEVNFVALKIIELLNNGIDINKISLANVSSDYYYILDKVFSYYNIPINIDFKDSIYNTLTVKEFLNNYEIDLEDKNKSIVNRKLINIVSSLSSIDQSTDIYRKLLIDKLKNTYFSPVKLTNAVNIRDLNTYSFSDDEYVFVLGFNQDSLPRMHKDIEYITDSIKSEVSMYDVSYLNKRGKDTVIYLLSRIKNLFLSYKLSTPFQSFYRSSLINDLGLEVIKPEIDNYKYSNLYNMLRLGEKLDKFYLFGEKDSSLEVLNTHYSIPYKVYTNKFTGIDKNLYLNSISKPIKLSYTSLNSFNECGFKYYINYVLKLDDYTDSFASFIGSMYHEILTLYRNNNFDFEYEFKKYLEKRDLSLKEKLFLVKIEADLIELIEVIKKQNMLTGFNDEEYERRCEVSLSDEVKFIGFIDKIMYYKKANDTYFSIVDYKTGTIDTHIEPIKYGLHMQLPTYLYLINKSHVFYSPIFTGIYYQNILFNYPTWSSKYESEKKDRYKLKGYSTDDTLILERFDPTIENSELIKSMKYDDIKGFSRYSKVMDKVMVDELVDYTEKTIKKGMSDIMDAKFNINPKVYDKDNVSCKFCKFRDLCFMKEKDLNYLDKVDDLSFLGGDY